MDSIHKYNKKGELVKPWEEGYYSVTTILDVRHKPDLWAWKLRVGEEVANDKMLDSQERGKAVHQVINEMLTNTEIAEGFDDYVYQLANAFILWQALKKPINIQSELYLVSERHGFAGTADLVCTIDGSLWIIDFKTGSKNIDHGLQLAAYRQAYKEMTDKVAKTACLYLTDKTKKGWQFVEYKEPVNVFLAHKKIFDWIIKKNPHKEPLDYKGGIIYAE